MILFFFYYTGDHPDLHSFPTRRSSDLCAGTHEMAQGHDGGTTIQYLIPRKAPVPPRPFPTATITQEDRKSTRLNSSHPSISYAVFCLKKKKDHVLAYLLTYLDHVCRAT